MTWACVEMQEVVRLSTMLQCRAKAEFDVIEICKEFVKCDCKIWDEQLKALIIRLAKTCWPKGEELTFINDYENIN